MPPMKQTPVLTDLSSDAFVRFTVLWSLTSGAQPGVAAGFWVRGYAGVAPARVRTGSELRMCRSLAFHVVESHRAEGYV